MNKVELKAEIQKALDGMPESFLQDILKYLKELQGKSADTLKLSHNLNRILNEDKELLKRLAE